jgi:chromosome segregation ATPase
VSQPRVLAAAAAAAAAAPVPQLQKLVSTQETLQQQLACQVDAAHSKDSTQQQQLDSMVSQLQDVQKQLADAHAAVAAMADELKAAEATKASLSAQLRSSQAAVSDRDAALDALADELVSVSGACDEQTASREQAEEQVGVCSAVAE